METRRTALATSLLGRRATIPEGMFGEQHTWKDYVGKTGKIVAVWIEQGNVAVALAFDEGGKVIELHLSWLALERKPQLRHVPRGDRGTRTHEGNGSGTQG